MQEEKDGIKLVKWMTEHPKVRRRICENGYEVTPEEFIEITELLEQHRFYDMIYILLVKNQSNDMLGQATSRLLIEKASKEWERIGSKELCREIKDKIRDEIKLKEARGDRL